MTDGLEYGLSDGFAPSIAPEEQETDILTILSDMLQRSGGKPEQISGEHVAENYISFIYNGHEFARMPEVPALRWFEFFMTPALKQKYSVDDRFAGVPEKNQNYWRVEMSRPEDLKKYEDVIIECAM